MMVDGGIIKSSIYFILAHLEEYCDKDFGCEKIRHSKCVKNKCVCRNNYIALNSTVCGPLLNGICSTNNDCIVANSDCIKNKCKCNVMYMEQYLNKCVPSMYYFLKKFSDLLSSTNSSSLSNWLNFQSHWEIPVYQILVVG